MLCGWESVCTAGPFVLTADATSIEGGADLAAGATADGIRRAALPLRCDSEYMSLAFWGAGGLASAWAGR